MIGVFYGSTTGNTEELAAQIAGKLGIESSDVYDVGRVPADKVNSYDCLLLGSSTWGDGELQDDWFDFISGLKKENLSGKKIGLFGCGDSSSYPDTFCDAIGIICEELEGSGCVFIGEVPAEGYSETGSKAFKGEKVLGLVVDDDKPNLTEQRITKWVESVKTALI